MKIDKPIVVACKESPERLPPVLALVENLSELADNVILITNKTGKATREDLENRGVTVVETWSNLDDLRGPKSLIGRARAWGIFRRGFWKTFAPLQSDALLWIATADSALAIGRKLLQYEYILGLLELYDKEYAIKRHQDFKWKYIATLPATDFEVELDINEIDLGYTIEQHPGVAGLRKPYDEGGPGTTYSADSR